MESKGRLKQFLEELFRHAPFTLAGALLGVGFLVLLRGMSNTTAHRLFQVFHPGHVILSAMVTAALFRTHRREVSFPVVLLVGIVGAIGVATLSDSLMPFIGERLLGLHIPAHRHHHQSHAPPSAPSGPSEMTEDRHHHSNGHHHPLDDGSPVGHDGETGHTPDPHAEHATHAGHEHLPDIGHNDSHEHGPSLPVEPDRHRHEANPVHHHGSESSAHHDGHGHDGQGHDEHGHSGADRDRLYLGFLHDWPLIVPAAIVGVVLGYVRPITRFPHFLHVLISTWASAAHILMSRDVSLSWGVLAGLLPVLFLSVWVPCCVSDIVFPSLFFKKLHAHCGCRTIGHEGGAVETAPASSAHDHDDDHDDGHDHDSSDSNHHDKDSSR